MNISFQLSGIQKSILGNPKGKNLYAVISVDSDDFEDTSIELFQANDEDDLYDHVKSEFTNGDEDMYELFDEDWGCKINYNHIGTNLKIN